MCGILAALGVSGDAEVNRRDILRLSKLLRHRGPDASGIYQSPDGTALIAFERLSIIDPSDYGKYVDKTIMWMFSIHHPCCVDATYSNTL